jgi:hypothetical protein
MISVPKEYKVMQRNIRSKSRGNGSTNRSIANAANSYLNFYISSLHSLPTRSCAILEFSSLILFVFVAICKLMQLFIAAKIIYGFAKNNMRQ